MCKWLKNLFHKSPPEEPEYHLSHPEEPVNYDQTAENISVSSFLDKWLIDWHVPPEFHDYWREAIVITVKPDLTVPINGIPTVVPAATYKGDDGKRHLDIRPEWLNPGVIAHEQAHNSYALLTDEQILAFHNIYIVLKWQHPLIKFLFSQNSYGLSSDVEGHAEIYRYLEGQIPDTLKPFYPKLMKEV